MHCCKTSIKEILARVIFDSQAKRIKFYFAFALLAVCLFTAGIQAQNQAPQVNQTTNRSPQPTVSPAASQPSIPFSDIIVQAENASSTLKEIAASASTDLTTETIERDLPALTHEINARLEETARTVEGWASLDTLRNFEADWRTLTRNLPEWRSDLNVRARKLEGDLQRLDELNDKWRQTLGELTNTETSPELLARIEEIIQTAVGSRRLIVSQQTRVVAMQNRVAEQQNRVEEALKTIGARREALVGQLLTQDSPSLWKADLWTKTNLWTGVRASLVAQFVVLRDFIGRNKDRLALHFLIFVLFAGALFYFGRWARPPAEADPESKKAAIIFYLPIPTAIVLAIFCSSRIYPQTPQILRAIFGAVALVPTVIILRKLVERSLYPLLYSLFVFYFIDQLRTISELAPALARLLFLIEMLGAFLFFLWLYQMRLARKEPPEGARDGRVFRVVRVASLVVLPFFAVAFLVNIFGYVNLARLVGDGVLRSAYTAVILYALIRIIDGIIVFALRIRRLNQLKMVNGYTQEFLRKAQNFIRLIIFGLWILITLEFFTLRQIILSGAKTALTTELTLGSLSVSAGDVLLFFAVVWAAFLISRFVRFALEEDVYPRLSLEHGIPYAISTIINYLILLIGFFFAVSAAGVDLTRITVLVGAFGVGIGFGLQNIFNNFISGLILLFERPVNVGDEIKIGEASGVVRRIGIRASRIRQWDNSEIIVPNSKLISENVKNGSYSVLKRGIEIPVSVAYGADVGVVHELLTDVARAHSLVAEKPAPQVLLSEIVSPSLNFKLRVWTAQADKRLQIAGELAIAVSKRLTENNIVVSAVTATPVS
jgi:potassium-dependent mechanosensitive channel